MAAEHIVFSDFISEAEYREHESHSPEKHEYRDGRIFAMAGASPDHNRLTTAAIISLGTQLQGKPCEPFNADQRVKAGAPGINTYPDVVVACPPLVLDDDNLTLLDATVIIEVLSPSTAQYDRIQKFWNYAQLPSLRHYVLVSQDEIAVEHRKRDGDKWLLEILFAREDELVLDAIECTLKLADLYARLDVKSPIAPAVKQ